MIGEYTVEAVVGPVLAVGAELFLLRTGVLRRARFWVTAVIVLMFEIPVDGWLTKLDAPIVLYRRHAISGIRFPWDIPIEDFGFGFTMVVLTLSVWEYVRAGRRRG